MADNFLAFLYKTKLNEIKLIDIYKKLSDETLLRIIDDINDNDNGNVNQNVTKKENIDIVYIFCDGGVKNNGKPNSKGAYSVYFNDEKYHKFNITKEISEPTNNKAELSGIRKICKILYDNKTLFKNKEIIICTDSLYSIKCVTTWYKNWIKNGWKTAKNEPVKNKDLIEQIINVTNNIEAKISFKHIFSHTKEPKQKDNLEWLLWNGNNIVDTNINKSLE